MELAVVRAALNLRRKGELAHTLLLLAICPQFFAASWSVAGQFNHTASLALSLFQHELIKKLCDIFSGRRSDI
jgi:hypothetical protein